MDDLYSKITFNQAKSDYKYIANTYGNPCDFCGTLCNCDFLFEVLNGEITRKHAYIGMIKYFWENGVESSFINSCSTDIRPNELDGRIQKIKERYFID